MWKTKTFHSIIIVFLLVVISSITVCAKEYFLFDAEKNSIFYMGAADQAFIEKISMEKKPDMMMPTGDPNKYLAIFTPEKGKKQDQAGQLILFNIATGRTEDLVDLGYFPFYWSYTKDHQHFFITYKPTPSSDSIELLHYNTLKMTAEKLPDIGNKVNDLILSLNEDKLYVMVSNKEKNLSQLKTFSYSPLKIEQNLPLGADSSDIYPLGNDRVAVIDKIEQNDASSGKYYAGENIRLIDTLANKVIQECKLNNAYLNTQWFKDERTLIIAPDDSGYYKVFGLKGKGQFYKVTADEINFKEIKTGYTDFDYLPETDCLYALTQKNVTTIDFRTNEIRKCNTRSNIFQNGWGHVYFYGIYHLPNSKMEVIYCPYNGNFRFYDYNENILIKDVSSRSAADVFLGDLGGNNNAMAVVNTNSDLTKYFIVNRVDNQVTIFNQNFERLSVLDPGESLLGMYQIKNPELQSIIVSGKKVYKINYEQQTLTPIYELKEKAKTSNLIEDNNRVIVWTDKEIVVLDSKTLEVKNQFSWFGNPNEKYTKLKKGTQRYYFLRSL